MSDYAVARLATWGALIVPTSTQILGLATALGIGARPERTCSHLLDRSAPAIRSAGQLPRLASRPAHLNTRQYGAQVTFANAGPREGHHRPAHGAPETVRLLHPSTRL
jgi:hypothetical protein